jgi:hypothetical protein
VKAFLPFLTQKGDAVFMADAIAILDVHYWQYFGVATEAIP